MITELIEFGTSDQLSLPGLLFTPEKPTTKLVIFLHGNGSSSVFYSTSRTLSLAQMCTNKGYAFLPFNNRGAHYIKKLKAINAAGEREDRLYGMAYELIKECVPDINGAIDFGRQRGFSEFTLMGHSSGASKIVVYDHYQPRNPVQQYILLGGGDDTGLHYQNLGAEQFNSAIRQCRSAISEGRGREFVSSLLSEQLISYQSLLDTIDPDGDYNVFPFYEYSHQLSLATKPLFRYLAAIKKPLSVIYGELDQYCSVPTQEALTILQKFATIQQTDVVSQADHSFTDHEQELASAIARCL
jgi:pimeloyl-ACP methyl ester carboxylesterase